MIARSIAFLVGFTLVKSGLPWWVLIVGMLVLTVGDTIVRRACVDEAVQDDLNRLRKRLRAVCFDQFEEYPMPCIGRLPKPLSRAWASAMKAERRGVIPAPRSQEEIMACPRTSDATRAWIIRIEQIQAKKQSARSRLI